MDLSIFLEITCYKFISRERLMRLDYVTSQGCYKNPVKVGMLCNCSPLRLCADVYEKGKSFLPPRPQYEHDSMNSQRYFPLVLAFLKSTLAAALGSPSAESLALRFHDDLVRCSPNFVGLHGIDWHASCQVTCMPVKASETLCDIESRHDYFSLGKHAS